MSLRQLAKTAGVSNPYLSQIERGLKKPSAEILQQIAKGLRISAETLYVRAGILEDRAGRATSSPRSWPTRPRRAAEARAARHLRVVPRRAPAPPREPATKATTKKPPAEGRCEARRRAKKTTAKKTTAKKRST